MKTVVTRFRVGQRVFALVKERLENGDIIAAFQGDLLRIRNQTVKQFSKGERVELEVRSTAPLSFRIYENNQSRRYRTTI